MFYMKNKVVFGVISLVFAAVVGTLLFQNISGKPTSSSNTTETPKPVPVDLIVQSPASFKGSVIVSGTVVRVDQPNSCFTLGCSDACVSMPVLYNGQSPKVGENIFVYGRIVNESDGKYIFEAREIKHDGT